MKWFLSVVIQVVLLLGYMFSVLPFLLPRFQPQAADREISMIKLKKQVNHPRKQLGIKDWYKIVSTADST